MIVGTAAFTPALAEIAAEVGAEEVIVALDSKNGKIVVKGWQEATAFTAEEVIRADGAVCSGFLCTVNKGHAARHRPGLVSPPARGYEA